MRACDACDGEIRGAPVLVPRLPRGSLAYCAKRACVAQAQRRARLAFPNISGKRGIRHRAKAGAS